MTLYYQDLCTTCLCQFSHLGVHAWKLHSIIFLLHCKYCRCTWTLLEIHVSIKVLVSECSVEPEWSNPQRWIWPPITRMWYVYLCIEFMQFPVLDSRSALDLVLHCSCNWPFLKHITTCLLYPYVQLCALLHKWVGWIFPELWLACAKWLWLTFDKWVWLGYGNVCMECTIIVQLFYISELLVFQSI